MALAIPQAEANLHEAENTKVEDDQVETKAEDDEVDIKASEMFSTRRGGHTVRAIITLQRTWRRKRLQPRNRKRKRGGKNLAFYNAIWGIPPSVARRTL